MKYIRQLDSIRAIAVILVLIFHWLPRNSIINYMPNGAIGVDTFFVLSGFLITGILLDNRRKAETLHHQKSIVLKNFYLRRVLRIFPIYYLVIFLLLIFHNSTGTNIKNAFPYFVTYTSNFYFFKLQDWDGMISHLWSLSVEEQFYLIWPFIVLFVSEKYLVHSIILFILTGMISQYIFIHNVMGDVLTTSCFDAFGLGALLAWIIIYKPGLLKKFYKILCIVAILSFIFGMAELINRKLLFLPARTHISIIALWLITYIVYKHDTAGFKMKWLFNNKWLIFLGKISYGIYLYHNMIPYITDAIAFRFFRIHLMDIQSPRYLTHLITLGNFIVLVSISWLSWNLIEKTFLNLKKYFEYQSERKPRAI